MLKEKVKRQVLIATALVLGICAQVLLGEGELLVLAWALYLVAAAVGIHHTVFIDILNNAQKTVHKAQENVQNNL